jgi:hypothetical protein
MKKALSVVIIGSISLSGCATNGISTKDRTEPTQPAFAYEKTFSKSQGEVWDKLVKNMAKSFFVINNIDKESRIINLSYSSNRPQDYVDCGRMKRTYSDAKTTESYEYGITDSQVTFKTAPDTQQDPRFSQVGTILRSASLDGRANVYVAPNGSGTIVSVNAKSIVKITTNGEVVTRNLIGTVMARSALPAGSVEVTAVTKGSTQNTVVSGTAAEIVTCYSTGRLEKDILDLAEDR